MAFKIEAANRMKASPDNMGKISDALFMASGQPPKDKQIINLQNDSRDNFQKLAKLRGITDAVIKDSK